MVWMMNALLVYACPDKVADHEYAISNHFGATFGPRKMPNSTHFAWYPSNMKVYLQQKVMSLIDCSQQCILRLQCDLKKPGN